MNSVYLVAARRSAVAPRDGAFRGVEVHDLAAAVIRAALGDAGMAPDQIEDVVLGNALYAGGNPARMAALAAGLPVEVPTLTLDTQCASGLDAVMLGAARIAAGDADLVVAGGLESFSRAPLRFTRPRTLDEAPREYKRPSFAPAPHRDPDLIHAAAALAQQFGITRAEQEAFAVESHTKALEHAGRSGIVEVAKLERDAFTRKLDPKLCSRLPVLAGDDMHGLTAATVAVEADAAAVVVLASERLARRAPFALRVMGGVRQGGDPGEPALVPVAAAKKAFARFGRRPQDLAATEIMEAFAVQALAGIRGIGLDPALVNTAGGALSRGHPIGASGAILCVQLYENAKAAKGGFLGLAAIAAAGGLGSALLLGD